MKIYLVGGAVRDKLMGLEPKDKDYVIVGANEKDIEKLKEQGFKEVGNHFPVFLHPETKDEYALARIERKISVGYNGFECKYDSSVTLEEDLLRRDLTINAIAYDEEKGEYIDPFGGINDIKNKILKNTSEAFREDPLRILRVARFACRYPDFKIDDKLKTEIMFLNRHPKELKSISVERIIKEIKKTWDYKNPSRFFYVLNELGSLNDFFPSLANLRGVEQSEKHHPEGDAFIHSMLAYDHIVNLTKDEDCIFAVLVHDLGKALTPKDKWPVHIAHEKRGVPLAESFAKRFKFSKERTSFISLFTLLHIKIHDSLNMQPKSIVKLFNEMGIRKKNDKSYDKLSKMLLCAKADSNGKLNKNYKQEKFLLNCYEAVFNVDRKQILEELKLKNKVNNLDKKVHDKKVSLLKKEFRSIKDNL
jgi:tRNA nucleotidyltransferase (CCA-adding enzyme)